MLRSEVFIAMKIDFMVFWVVAPGSTLKMEAAWSSKMVVSNHHTT